MTVVALVFFLLSFILMGISLLFEIPKTDRGAELCFFIAVALQLGFHL